MDIIQIVIGLIVAAHGLVHLMFEFYVQDPNNDKNFGWSGDSWLLTKIMSKNTIRILGRILWALVIISFTAAGLGIVGLPIVIDWWKLLIIIASALSLLSYLLFWNGLAPSPWYFIVGIILDIAFLALPFV